MRIINLILITLDGRNRLSLGHLIVIVSIIIEILGSQNIACIQLCPDLQSHLPSSS